jgi:CRP-like cAMP-binding protein
MREARIELLQRMPVFGGIRADVLEFLLGLCPVISVPANEFFFQQNDQADSMFVLEAGKVVVLKSWRGRQHFLRTLQEGDCFGEMAIMSAFRAPPRSVQSRTARQSVFPPPTSTESTSGISSSSH